MRQITSDLDNFNKNLVVNFANAKDNMQRHLLELFKTTSKERLPDSFLMSLPKWGKNATKLHHIFSKSINRKRTDTAADRREVPFELTVQPEVLEDIESDIHDLIDLELKQMAGEKGVIITEMQKILTQVAELMACLRLVEKQKQELKTEVVQLDEQLLDKKAHIEKMEARIATLEQEMREKDMEQDRLRDKCQREVEQGKKNRVIFFREICRYKTDIFRLEQGHTDNIARVQQTQQQDHAKQSPRSRDGKEAGRRESAAGQDQGGFDTTFDFGGESGDTQAAVEDAERRVRSEMEETLKRVKAEEREKFNAMKGEMKEKVQQEKDNVKILEQKVHQLEMENVEKSREIRKLKAATSYDDGHGGD